MRVGLRACHPMSDDGFLRCMANSVHHCDECWNCYYVCYCIVDGNCDGGVAVSQCRYDCCCHCYFTHIIIIGFFYLICFFFFFLDRREYIMLYNIIHIYELHRIASQQFVSFASYMNATVYTLAQSKFVLFFYVCHFSEVLLFAICALMSSTQNETKRIEAKQELP